MKKPSTQRPSGTKFFLSFSKYHNNLLVTVAAFHKKQLIKLMTAFSKQSNSWSRKLIVYDMMVFFKKVHYSTKLLVVYLYKPSFSPSTIYTVLPSLLILHAHSYSPVLYLIYSQHYKTDRALSDSRAEWRRINHSFVAIQVATDYFMTVSTSDHFLSIVCRQKAYVR